MSTSTEGSRKSSWLQRLAWKPVEQGDGPSYVPRVFGSPKTGRLVLKRNGELVYDVLEGTRLFKDRFHVEDVVRARVESSSEYLQRTTAARVAGGAVIGGVLLGPLGAAIGLGTGVLAKKTYRAGKFMVIELRDGRTVSVEVERKYATQAGKLLDAITG